MSYIPDPLYKKIRESIPIPCVDLVIVSRGHFLLGKRKNVPAQGEWFVPGGRMLKGELVKNAAARKLKEEVGIDAKPEEFELIAAGDTIYTLEDDGEERHSINIVYRYENDELLGRELTLDADQLTEILWFEKIDPSWSPYVQMCLQKAGFKE